MLVRLLDPLLHEIRRAAPVGPPATHPSTPHESLRCTGLLGAAQLRKAGPRLTVMAAAMLLVGCDSDWFLYARNETNEPVVLRVVSPTFTEVFSVPRGFDGYVDSETGTHDAVIELVDQECTVVQSVRSARVGASLVTVMPDGRLTIEPSAYREPDVPAAEELRGVCGSTKAP